MVVMDVIRDEYRSFDDLFPVSPAHCDHIEANIVTLHEAGYVHGDLRDINIMARGKGELEFMLIDFDWAGKVGEVKYPMYVNRKDVWRPDDAYDGQLITVEHDMQMLDAMFRYRSQ
jgi:RIO-like serine/threonine protein kinase